MWVGAGDGGAEPRPLTHLMANKKAVDKRGLSDILELHAGLVEAGGRRPTARPGKETRDGVACAF